MLSGHKGNRKKRYTENSVTPSVISYDGDQCSIATPSSQSVASPGIDLSSSLINTAFSTYLTTSMNELLTDYLTSRHYTNEELIFCAQQLVRAAILLQLNTSPSHILSAPFIKYYYYLFIEDENEDEASMDALAGWLATGTLLTYDIITSPASLVEATATGVLSIGTSYLTKYLTTNSHHWLKNSFFSPKAAEEPKQTTSEVITHTYN